MADQSISRWIDKIPAETPRPVEMEVLCLGLSRTATMSLWTGLKKLGYKTYHFMENGDPQNGRENHLLCWREALIAKLYGSGKPYGKAEFDKLLRRYSAVTDSPCVNFSDELLAAYPNAKVVLTTRDPDNWLASMHSSFHRVLDAPSWNVIAAFDTIIQPLNEVFRLVLFQWSGGDWHSDSKLREGYIKHNEHIRAVVPKENLLEWHPKDGWEPLCKFIGKPVPAEPFPHINKGTDVSNMLLGVAYTELAKWMAWKLAWPAGAAGVAALAWSYFKWVA